MTHRTANRIIPGRQLLRYVALLLLLVGTGTMWAAGNDRSAATDKPAAKERSYAVDYVVEFDPENHSVQMSIEVRQERNLLRRLRFEADPKRYQDFTADGKLEQLDGDVIWEPPASGGTLHYRISLDHQRDDGGYDSLVEPTWAVFRGDDLLPPVSTRTLKGAKSQSRLRFEGPGSWTFITPYPQQRGDSDWYLIDRPDRKFDRPVGWMAAGKLGIRWEDIDDYRLAIAGPRGHSIRRMDIAAFLRWNLPALVDVFPDFPHRILVVSAGDPMWRGGLSGPASLFIHADRPLISANGTSTLLHEMIHLAQGFRASMGNDWIVESMAEYYTLEVMRRSGTISRQRFDQGLDKLESWSSTAGKLQADESSGSRTAKGVAIMHALDAELREVTHGGSTLDDVARALSQKGGEIGLSQLREVSEALAGTSLESIPSY